MFLDITTNTKGIGAITHQPRLFISLDMFFLIKRAFLMRTCTSTRSFYNTITTSLVFRLCSRTYTRGYFLCVPPPDVPPTVSKSLQINEAPVNEDNSSGSDTLYSQMMTSHLSLLMFLLVVQPLHKLQFQFIQ